MNVVWGIRWDREDDRRQRLLMAAAMVAALAAVALLLMLRGSAPVAMHAVIVRAEPGKLAAAQRAVEHSGGTIGQSLPIVNGFVAQVPADSERALGAIVASVGWVIAHRNDNGLHVRVLNLSFGTPPSKYQSDLLAYAVEQAWKAGIVVVVSAGNEGEKGRGLTSPGYDPFVLSVGADDLAGTAAVGDDVVPSWSSRGAGRNPDLVAPGRSIVSLRDPNSALDRAHPEARVGDAGFKGSGTSQAAAVVSGAVALLLERRPDLSPDQVKAIIKSTADPLSGPGPDAQGAGRLNFTRSLAAAAPSPDAARQLFAPAQIRGVVAVLVAHLPNARHANVGPIGPDGSSWGGAKWGAAKWGGSSWGGSSWGGSSWGGSSWGGSSWGGSSWGGSSWGGSSWASTG